MKNNPGNGWLVPKCGCSNTGNSQVKSTWNLAGKLCYDNYLSRIFKKNFPQADIFGYSPLLGGLFEKDADGDWPANYDTEENRKTVTALQDLSREEGISPSSLVLKTMADSGIIPVTSTSRPQRLAENMQLLHERQTV